jgi:predicted transcriptional regulator
MKIATHMITAFEVISYSAIKHADLHDVADDYPKIFPKIFPKLIDKLIPTSIQEKDRKDRDIVVAILSALVEPKSAKDLASIASCSVRTIKDKYLDKMLESEVITMTIPDKPTSRNQKYKIHIDRVNKN